MKNIPKKYHSAVRKLIKKAVDKREQELVDKADELWLLPPWSPEWNDEFNKKVTGYRMAIKDIINLIKKEL